MPVYNAEKYLSTAIESILKQTYKNIELICVNDCSTDDSLNILIKYKNNDSRIKIINNQKNMGSGYSRNIGLNNTAGKYVLFLDADDFYEHNAVEVLHNELIGHNVYVVCSNIYEYKNGNDIPMKLYSGILYVPDKQSSEFFISTIAKIYDVDFLNKYNIRFGDYRISEDRLFMQKIYAHIDKIWLSDFLSYHWRYSATSLSHSEDNSKFFEALVVANECLEYSLKYRPDIINADSDIERIMNWCYRIHPLFLKQFVSEVSKFCVKWNFSAEKFKKKSNYALYSLFCANKYALIMFKVFVAALLKFLCIFVPIKSLRHKIRKIYRF